jgi:hypothetical protein
MIRVLVVAVLSQPVMEVGCPVSPDDVVSTAIPGEELPCPDEHVIVLVILFDRQGPIPMADDSLDVDSDIIPLFRHPILAGPDVSL